MGVQIRAVESRFSDCGELKVPANHWVFAAVACRRGLARAPHYWMRQNNVVVRSVHEGCEPTERTAAHRPTYWPN